MPAIGLALICPAELASRRLTLVRWADVASDGDRYTLPPVLDAWDTVWCSARGSTGKRGDLGDFVRLAAARKGVPLIRGGKFDTSLSGRMGDAYLKSFGSCYAVLLRFSGPFDNVKVRAIVASAINQIETLTLKLPPPDGPGSGGNEALGVA
jgi:hypothetical protein